MNLRLVERFTRVDRNTLLYEFTAEDATTWTQPWTAEFPIVSNDALIYEYACHEGNYGMTNLLTGARVTVRNEWDVCRALSGVADSRPAGDVVLGVGDRQAMSRRFWPAMGPRPLSVLGRR